jgi:hypothetical protein
MFRLAKLTESQLSDVRKLEAKWKGIILLAYEKPLELASLSNEQLKKLQKLEQELGVNLLAYK